MYSKKNEKRTTNKQEKHKTKQIKTTHTQAKKKMNYFCQWPSVSFLRQDETRVLASEALRDKDYVVFLFGAPWDKRYNNFIPQMRAFYDLHHEAKKFELVLICRGDTEEEILTDFYNPEFAPVSQSGQRGTTFTLPCDARMAERIRQANKNKKKAEEAASEGEKVMGGGFSGEKKTSGEVVVVEREDGTITAEVPRVGRHGNYLCLDPADSEPVGSPLLYFFRVWSYPGIVVCRNRPPVESPKEIWPLTPRPSPFHPALVRPPVALDEKGRRKYSPLIKDRRCEPDICTIAGRWMMETRDPEAKDFPWDTYADGSTCAILLVVFIFFLAFLGCVLGYVLAKDKVLRDRFNNMVGYTIFR